MNKKVLSVAVVVIIIAVAVVVVVATGGNDDKSSSSSTSGSSTSTTDTDKTTSNGSSSSNSDSQATATDTVNIDNFAFSPTKITVRVGTKVTWTNKDSASHTVTADSGDGPDSGTLATGATYSFTYMTAGTFAYHCEFHSGMHGTVVVTQ